MVSITLQLSPELEQQLRLHAAQQGIHLDRYILNALQERLRSSSRGAAALSNPEDSPHNPELPNPIVQAIAHYIQDQPTLPDFPTGLRIALETFLLEQGYLAQPKKRLRITPAEQGSGYQNTAIDHDQVLANLPAPLN
jgi:hypothetical protein